MKRRLATAFLLIYLSISILQAQTFTATPNSAIADEACNEFNLSVSGPNTIMDEVFGIENICLNISHPFVGDLRIWLRTPLGKEVLLSENNGGNGDNYSNTCFDGISAIPVSHGTAPFTGSFLPEEPLGLINDGTENSDGTWVLRICDDVIFGQGTLIDFSITFGNSPALIPTPDNDDCGGAIPITINESYTCNLKTDGSLSGATNSGVVDGCNFGSNYFDDDVWFSFVPHKSDLEASISSITGDPADLVFEVLTGSCNSLMAVDCHDSPDAGFEMNNLSVGSTYFLRIASKSSGVNTDFKICLREVVPDPPSNDDCLNATSVSVSNNGTCNPVSGTVAGAGPSGTTAACQDVLVGNFNDDVWYSFQAIATVLEFDLSNVSGSNTALDYQLLSGSCPGLNEVFCYTASGSSQSFFVSQLTENATYFLRIASFQTLPQNTTFDLCIKTPGSSSNPYDDCDQAGQIPINVAQSCTNTISGSLVDAQPSTVAEVCSSIAPFTDDVWFTFDAQETTYELSVLNITGPAPDLIFELLEGNCSGLTSILCHDDPDDIINLTNLSIGSTYFVRIASYDILAQTTSFELCLKSNVPPPPNDRLFNVSTISSDCNNPTSGTLYGATPTLTPATTCTFNEGTSFQDDVWFVLPNVSNSSYQINVDVLSGDDDLVFEVFTGPDTNNLTFIRCHDDPNTELILTNLVIGQNCYLRIASWSAAAQTTTFDICATTPPTPPSNDECVGATEYPAIDTSCQIVSLTLVGATPSAQVENCPGALFFNDIWVEFVAHQEKEIVEFKNIVNVPDSFLIQLGTGSCATYNEVACNIIATGQVNPKITLENLTPSQTYLLRIASYNYNALNTTFSLCIHDTIPDPPANDECVAAVAITPSSTQTCTSSVSGTLLGAIASDVTDCAGSGGFDDDVWYKFVAKEVSQTVALENIMGSSQDIEVQVLGGSCGSLSEIACHHPMTAGSSTSFEVSGLTKSSTYYIRVASFPTGIQTTTFDICVHDTIPDPPANDECAGALAITVSTGTSCTSTTSGTLLGATASGVASTCASGGDFDDDVWFSFVAAEVSQVIELSSITGSTQDLDIQVNAGACVDLSEIACHRAGSPGPTTSFEVNGLIPGNTYYIRVASFSAGMQTTSFDICVKSVDTGCSLLVTSTQNSGAGTLRAAIDCAVAGDTIKFDASVFNQTIGLDLPVITIDKNLVIFTEFLNNITLSNASSSNTEVLMSIQDQLSIHGLKIIGQTAESMIFKLESGGNLEVKDVEMDKITVDKN